MRSWSSPGPHTLEAVSRLVRNEGFTKVQAIVAGGERRQDSVGAGLAALPEGIEIVVIHDGARPLAEPELFDSCAAAAAESGAAIAATPVADTLKRVAGGPSSRKRSIAPGCGPRRRRRHSGLESLRRAMAASSGETITDEARLCEARRFAGDGRSRLAGESESDPCERIFPWPTPCSELVTGSLVGRPLCLARATRQCGYRRIGYDAHRFASGRPPHPRRVVEIAHDRGLDGHSDADVLLHAIADAILGAAALGDIGQHFPPSDERFRDADSQVLLREAVRLAREAGWAPRECGCHRPCGSAAHRRRMCR